METWRRQCAAERFRWRLRSSNLCFATASIDGRGKTEGWVGGSLGGKGRVGKPDSS